MNVRISLTDRLAVEVDGVTLDEDRFPGRQGRIVFAYLAAQEGRPVPRYELAELLWGNDPPATWEKALRVLMTKLRALLVECGIDGSTALTSAFGCYKLALPDGTWIDLDAAADATARAEAAVAAGDLATAREEAARAAALARRSFLPGEEGAWVEERRRELRELLVRSLECLSDAAVAGGDPAEAVRYAAEVTELEPFRESGYRRLMEAHVSAGNQAEALRVYDACRRFLADELGAYPSPETEAVYLEIIRTSPKSAVAEVGGDIAPVGASAKRGHRRVALVVIVALLAVAAAVAAFLFPRVGEAASPEPLPNSLVRLDPKTLKPTKVIPVGPRADFVVAAGGYVWITHGILHYTRRQAVLNSGDRALTRVDPVTGESRGVGNGLAPCGLTADPSGDLWVANCYASGKGATVVRVDARTLEFEATWRLPTGAGFVRGMAYGNGSLWVTDGNEGARKVTEIDPRTGPKRSIRLNRRPAWMTWSDDYGDLWMGDFEGGTVSRLHAATEREKTSTAVAANPGYLLVDADSVWVGDWDIPDLVRLPAIGSGTSRSVHLPVHVRPAGVTTLAAGAGAIWATVPDDHAVWRIDPKAPTDPIRIPLRFYPWGVAVSDEGIWVTLRAHDE